MHLVHHISQGDVMSRDSFSAQVGAWVAETRERMVAVRAEAAQRLVEIMQTPVGRGGNMPVDSGFLWSSLRAEIGVDPIPVFDKPEDMARMTYNPDPINFVIIGAQAKDAITVAFGARYARAVEFGSRGRPGRRFVSLAAQQWPRVVTEVAVEAQRGPKGG